MEIRYTRALNRNYIHFLPDHEPDPDSYEMHMILSGQAECLLPCSLTKIDGSTFLSFDISAGKPLSSLADRGAFGEEAVRRILLALLEALRSLTQCLLDLAHVPLHPDYMFFAENPMRILLCYFPGDTQNPWQDLSEVMSFLLKHLDPSDRNALLMTYSLYREVLDGSSSPEVLLLNAAGPAAPREEEGTETDRFSPEYTAAPYAEEKPVVFPDSIRSCADEAVLPYTETAKSRGITLWILFALCVLVSLSLAAFSLTAVFPPKAVRIAAAVFAAVSVIPGALGVRRRLLPRRTEKESAFSIPSERLPEVLPADDPYLLPSDVFFSSGHTAARSTLSAGRKGTTLLSAASPPRAVLVPAPGFLQPGISLPEQTVICGAQPGEGGIVIQDETVSRMHARIHCSESGYFLEDLSSTNGTFVNGKAVLGKEKKKLRDGDRVRIAALEYVFSQR